MPGPNTIQRIEGAAWLAAATFAYDASGWQWWAFFALLLAPDLMMIGYLAGNTVGAASYNLGHTFVGPAALFAWWWSGGPDATLAWGAIWLAHIGMDRVFGYGLKLRDGFEQTHLGPIGRAKRAA